MLRSLLFKKTKLMAVLCISTVYSGSAADSLREEQKIITEVCQKIKKENPESNINTELVLYSHSNHFVLKLNDIGLSILPKEIGQLSWLREINLNNNRLTSISKEICNLGSLEKIYIRNNQLATIPTEIDKLNKLRVLDVSYNYLSDFPEEIFNLKNLEILNLSNNSHLPLIVFDFKKQPKLKTLWIGNMNIRRSAL